VAEIRLKGGELDGLLLHYLSEGQGPVTVLLHGLGGFAGSWRHTIPELRRHGRVIALDLPGFGKSGKPRRAYTLTFLTEALDAFLRALGLEQVRLVGHSMGGAVAACFAVTHPARVERLALLASAVPGFPLRPSWVYRTLSLPGLGELLSRLITRRICATALERCFVSPDAEEIRFFVDHEFSVRASVEGRAAYLSLLRSLKDDFTRHAEGYREGLLRFRRPILLVHGVQDAVIPFAHAQQVNQALDLATAKWLDRCGHFPQIEHAATVNTYLTEFLFEPASR